MKKLLPLFTWLFTIQCMAQNTWTQKADFGGTARRGTVGFAIGTKGYMGTGYDDNYKKDFWEYDPSTNIWTQKADFGGIARTDATGFSIGSKGYIGTGYDDDSDKKDFWEYDPSANTWTQKADFGGAARDGATGFSIGTKGYIGLGYDGEDGTKDFWEYDPSVNTWAQKTDFGGVARYGATGFVVGTKGYIGTGYDGSGAGTFKKDFWEYDPSANAWTSKADFGGTARLSAAGFSIGTKGYIGTGFDGIEYKDFWEYDPSVNTWTQKADFAGTARASAIGFSIDTKGYVGTGQDVDDFTIDFWEYTPSTVLPVTLTNVNTYQKNQGVQVEWTAQQENNIDRYEVERSQNGQRFSKLESVQAKGNSSVIINYNLFDPNPFAGVTFYRIKIIDRSTQVTYSQVMKVNISSGATLITVYPNPLNGNTIVLQMSNLQKGSYTITLTNKPGQRIITKVIDHAGGSASKTIELSKALAPGVYQVRVTGGSINKVLQIIKD